MITQPADGDGDNDVIEKNLTDYSRRLIIENLSTKGIILPLKVPRVFKEVVFEKVKLKKDPVDEIIVVDADAVICVNGDVDDLDNDDIAINEGSGVIQKVSSTEGRLRCGRPFPREF